MTKNSDATRFYSDKHEKSVCRELGAIQQSNSGAGRFDKGDVIIPDTMLIECKTVTSEKKSVSVKREWFSKNKEEAFRLRLSNSAVCINFGPDTENIYCINSKLMKFLIEALQEDN